ncbi:MAG: alpha-mannosidase, partial [Anaerolineae bacterium]|nr:alpha-mannosidase [Anaerolineae bacterium]
PSDAMLATVRACRSPLRPLLDCRNGSTAPLLYAFGHSHIDVAWLWPLAETERKAGRTLSTQLALLDEYPEYRFLFGQPHLYCMIRDRYPEIYGRLKDAAERGQIMPEGGMWVQADTNVSGGEALIRQFVHGKRFFQDEFGVDCKLMWLPDVFGYSGALPQIMRGCGIPYFSTAKIFWAYNGGDPFPYNTFTWEGIDGSEVLVHLCNDYNSEASPSFVADRWNGRVQKDGISSRLMPFGYGDGGGGPTRNHLEFLRREQDLEGLPRVRIASPIEFFKDQESSGIPDARYVGELYFQAHRGTYTSQAKTKRGNRKSELALREAEIWSVAAANKDFEFPRKAIDEAWKKVLLNQFHDIIPGSSIHRVYEEAEQTYAEVIATAEQTAAMALDSLTTNDDSALTVFNSLSWRRTALVALAGGVEGAATESGQPLPLQKIGDETWAEVTVPSCGWATLRPAAPVEIPSTLTCTQNLLENEHLRIRFNSCGEITSILDKDVNRELAAGPCNS